MSVARRLEAMLFLAEEDANAATALAAIGNRYAAYHCQQAVEKLVKAVLLTRGIESGVKHRLDVLIDKLPKADPWTPKLRLLEKYSPYATAFRYPTPGGRIPSSPDPGETSADAETIVALITEARATFL